MLRGKQRSYLKSLSNNLEVIVHIGKEGITDTVISSIEQVIEKRELIKGRVLDNTAIGAKEAANTICDEINADFVQAVGSTFVIYKKSKNDPKIVLPK